MSSSNKVNVQKHLACHDYHMGLCALPKEKCPYSHVGKSWGICPNKHYCTTPHKQVDCPLDKSNSCPHGDKCTFKHPKKNEEKINEEEEKTIENKIPQKKLASGLRMENFKSSLIELNQDLRILLPFLEKKKEEKRVNQYSSSQTQGSLDLCFIIDVTGSMSSWISQTKQYVQNTLNSIFDDYPEISLRVSFSGYRDYCDGVNRFTLIEFTNDIKSFLLQMNGVSCLGGGDEAEDVAGGLDNALSFDWQAIAKQVIFIADSPCHGSKYHEGRGDDYPNGDPDGRQIEFLMIEFQKKQIDFTVVEVSSTTKKMFSIMKESYGEKFVLKNLNDRPQSKTVTKTSKDSDFSSAVHESIMTTITTSFSRSGISSGSGAVAAVVIDGEKNVGAAYKLIMENKKFKNSFSHTKSKEKASSSTFRNKNNILIEQLKQMNIDEENEFDSDDSQYEEKLNTVCKKQYQEDVKSRQEREELEKNERLLELKTQFPSHYFETVEETELRSQKGKKIKEKLLKVEYLKGKINWDNFDNFNDYQAVCHSFELVKNYRGGTEVNWKNLEVRTYFLGTKVRISNLVFSEGAMRYAFHAKDLYLKQKMVAKQLKKQEKHKKLTILEMKKDMLTQIVCKEIVKEFNSKLLQSNRMSNNAPLKNIAFLQFIDSFIYEMTFPYTSSPLYYFEQYIEGEYQKFNNNAGYVNQSDSIFSQLAQTLSHFSWQLSKGYLTVVDLQGDYTGILTDPQIHCLDTQQFGDGNLGYEGILRFFATHQCNEYCRKLQLIHPKESSQIPFTNNFFAEYNSMSVFKDCEGSSSEEAKQKNQNNSLSQLCDLCHHPQLFSLSQYIESKQKSLRLICSYCKPQVEKTTFQKECQICKKQVSFSTYECIQLRRDVPPMCEECQKLEQ